MAAMMMTGRAPTYTAIVSAISTQVSRTPTVSGRYQRSGSRSTSSQMMTSGTCVPM